MQIYTTIYIKHCKILAIDLHCLQLTCYFYSTSLAFLYVWFQSKLDKSLIALQNDENWTAFWHMQVYLYISSWLLSDQFLCFLQTRTCFSDGYFFWHRWLQLNSIWYFSYLCSHHLYMHQGTNIGNVPSPWLVFYIITEKSFLKLTDILCIVWSTFKNIISGI